MVVLCRDSQPDSGLVSRQNPVRETVSHLVSLSRSCYMYNTWMQKFVEDRCFFFFSCYVFYITRFPDGQYREKERGEENWSSFTSETREGTEEEAQCHESFTGRSTLWQINPTQTGGRGGDRRESRGASQEEVSLRGQRVCCVFNCSSPRPPSLVPPGIDRSIGRNVTGPRHSRQS